MSQAPMAKFIAAIQLVLGGFLASRGFVVWNDCGYDCGISATNTGFTATASMLLGLILLGAGILVVMGIAASHLKRSRYKS